jgi:hypothetical protein
MCYDKNDIVNLSIISPIHLAWPIPTALNMLFLCSIGNSEQPHEIFDMNLLHRAQLSTYFVSMRDGATYEVYKVSQRMFQTWLGNRAHLFLMEQIANRLGAHCSLNKLNIIRIVIVFLSAWVRRFDLDIPQHRILKHFLYICLLCIRLELCEEVSLDNLGWIGAQSGVPHNFSTISVKSLNIWGSSNTCLSDRPISECVSIVICEGLAG